MNMRQLFSVLSAGMILLVSALGYYIHLNYFLLLILILPLVWIGVVDMVQEKQSIRRNFPVLGRLRYVFEDLRPKIQLFC